MSKKVSIGKYSELGMDTYLYKYKKMEKYLSDVLGRTKGWAEALVKPISSEEVSGILKYAHEKNIPVTPRGAGTNLVGSTVPDHGGIVLDLSLINHILEIDRETMTATVEAGVVLEDEEVSQNVWKTRGTLVK